MAENVMNPVAPSRARKFFDEIVNSANPAEALKNLIVARASAFETEYLDYKGAENLEPSGDELPKLWSKTLSCLVNSERGVLIRGINAPRNVTKNLSLVKNLE